MSLFQCQRCGCVESTSYAGQGFTGVFTDYYDWSTIPERKGLMLCSVCGPTRYSDGKPTEYGTWHDEHPRVFVPLGEFHTNGVGNLEHTATGSEDFMAFVLDEPPEVTVP